MKNTFLVCILALGLIAVLPSQAQVGVSQANGTVRDQDDNPIEGAVVTFRPQANPTMVYSGKSNKKGRYYVSGLWTPKEGDRWDVTVAKDGYLPIKVTVESRNVNKVLIGDIMNQELRAGSKIADIVIRPLGTAKVDLTLAPEEQVVEQTQQALSAAALPQGSGTVEAGAAPVAEIDPWDKALTLASSGDLAGSVESFDTAIEKAPEDAERREIYAKVLYELESYDEAEVQAVTAIELAPDRLDPRKILSSIYIGRGDFVKALQTLEAAGELAPDDVDIHERRAYVAGQTGQTQDAISAYEAITRIDPESADAWLALGGLYAKAGDMARSEQAYRKVVELDPSQAFQTFYNLGVLIMNRRSHSDGDTRRAIDAFRKSVEIKPDYAPAYQQLAFALLGTGDKAGALQALQEYLRVSPDAPDAGRVQGMIQTLQK